MKPPPFEYRRAESVEEALELLAADPEGARPLAGGQSLVPAMNFRLSRPALLVDLNPVGELAGVRPGEGGGLRIGAMTRQREAERDPEVARRAPLLAEAMPHLAHPQIRNRGTIGGSLAHADPAAELPAVVLAREGVLVLRGVDGGRRVEAAEFFRSAFGTALEPGELLVELELPPLPPRSGWAFEEFSRRHGDFALVGVAAGVVLDREGRVGEASLVHLGVGPGPVRSEEAPGSLVGRRPEAAACGEAARAAAARLDPPADLHASPAYRRHLAEVLAGRALRRAAARAAGAVGAGREEPGDAR